MTPPPTYYHVLGVRSDASLAEIRSAYLRMMKLHHPDSAPGSKAASDFAAALNLCYATLKDPQRRARHDRQLADHAVRSRLGPQRRLSERRLSERRMSQRRDRRVRLTAAAFLSVALAVAVAGVALGPALVRLGEDPSLLASLWGQRDSRDTRLAPVTLADPVHASRLAKLARTLPTPLAERLSRDCFTSAARRPADAIAQSCILFDVAFQYWHMTPDAGGTMPPHFSDQVSRNRHLAILNELGANATERLAELRVMALQALVEQLESEVIGADPITASAAPRPIAGHVGTGDHGGPVPNRDSNFND